MAWQLMRRSLFRRSVQEFYSAGVFSSPAAAGLRQYGANRLAIGSGIGMPRGGPVSDIRQQTATNDDIVTGTDSDPDRSFPTAFCRTDIPHAVHTAACC